MKLPSIKYLFLKSTNTLYRFPFTIGIAILGTLAALYVVDFNYDEYTDYTKWYHFIMTCAIGIPMFISLSVYSERLEVTKSFKLIIRSAGFIFLFLYYITLPDIFLEKHYIRMIIWLLVFHLLVSFAPYIGFRNQHSFWLYNKTLFIRLLITALYSIVLYLGISLALLAIDQLFDINVPEEYYLRLWIIIIGIFNVWFFLAGVPKHYRQLDLPAPYPAGIKIFTQYILIPLVIIYALILYTYFIKIIVTQDWPVGWVVYLVLGYSILGIFSFLLLFPIQEEKLNKGIRMFSRIFFISLFPLLVMFFIAIIKRVSEYGITENRFFVILLGVWLVFNAGFIIITKYKMIRIIPISLAILALLSINGPWNVFKISKAFQLNRFETFLTKNNLLKDGKAVKATKEISIEDDVELCSIMTYIADVHGYKNLQPYFNVKLDTLFVNDSARYYSNYDGVSKLTDVLGIEYNLYNYNSDENNQTFSYTSQMDNYDQPMEISGYDYFVNYRVSYYSYDYRNINTKLNEDTVIKNSYVLADSSHLDFAFIPTKGMLNISYKDSVVLEKNIFEYLGSIESKSISGNNGYYQFEKTDMTFSSDNNVPAYKITLTYISGEKDDKTIKRISELQANILIKLKP